MPNGGSDCCGTYWFNPRARAASEGDPAQQTIGHYREIRGLAIERAYWTYCANHPHRSPARDPIPIGPVKVGKDLVRKIWQLSPDTEDIRLHLLELAARHSLPVVSIYKDFAEAGGFIAYGPSLTEMYRGGAEYVDRILKGAKPGRLPIEQPRKFDLLINLKTAKALGITISPLHLARADEIIE